MIVLSLSMGEKPNTHAAGEKFPAELYWQHLYAVWERVIESSEQ